MINNLMDFFKSAGANVQQAMSTAAAAMPPPGSPPPGGIKPVEVVWGNDKPEVAKPGNELRTFGTNLAREVVPNALPTPESQSTTNPALVNKESGGRWDAKNDAVGSGGRVGHFGRIQFGRDRYSEAQAAGVVPRDMPIEQFATKENANIQVAAENWHWKDIEDNIRRNGLDAAIGSTIAGIPVTLEGLKNVAHLGGKGGMEKFIRTGGRYNPADSNGTRLSDYLAMGASGKGLGGPQGGSQSSGGLGFDPALGRAPTEIAQMGEQMGSQGLGMGMPESEVNPYTAQLRTFEDQPYGTLLQQIQLQMGSPEGSAALADQIIADPILSGIANGLIGADNSNLSMGTSGGSPTEGNIQPTTALSAAENSTDPADQEAAALKKQQNRRERIANLLQVIGVGLGQMSAGQAVNASEVIGMQQQQRQFDATRADEAAKAAYDPSALANMLASSGNPQAAALAYQGREGYDAAMQIAQTQFTPSKSANGGVSPQEIDGYARYLEATGDAPGAAFVRMGGEEAYKRHISLYGDEGAEAATIPEFADRVALREQAIKYGLPQETADLMVKTTDPKLYRQLEGQVLDRVTKATAPVEPEKGENAPRSPEALGRIAAVLERRGKTDTAELVRNGDLSPAAIDKMLINDNEMANAVNEDAQKRANEVEANSEEDKANGKQVAEGLRQIGRGDSQEARLFETVGVKAGTQVLEYAKTATDETNARIAAENVGKSMANMFPDNPELQLAFRNAKNSTDITNALDAAKFLKPDIPNEKILFDYAKQDPEFSRYLLTMKRSAAGQMSQKATLQYKQFETVLDQSTATMMEDKKLYSAMEQMQSIVTQPGYESGKVQEAFALPLQNWADSLGLDIDFVGSNQEVGMRLMQALQASNFQFLRAEGSGAMSDFESQQFLQALPGIGDTTVQAAAVSQAYLAMADARSRNHSYTLDYLAEYGDTENFSAGQEYKDYMNKRAEQDGAGKDPFQNFQNKGDVAKALQTGTLKPGAVYRVMDENGNMTYKMVGRKMQ